MDKKVEEIYNKFEGKLIGTFKMKNFVCKILSKMPDSVINFITKKCWFMSSMDDAWAFTFRGNDLKNQYLIFVGEELLRQNDKQIYYSLAHEIGHVVLNHRNSIYRRQSKGEIQKQEEEADKFARKFS